MVRVLHEKGIGVAVWTVNEEDDMLRMIGWGVHGIITDFPGRLRGLLPS